jgi:DedD protein
MDHELKQRLIGAVVVTALAAIFIPMLFDDPVDTSGKAVKELAIPEMPAEVASETSQNLPANKAQVLNRQDIELEAREINEDGLASPAGEEPATDAQNGEEIAKSGEDDAAKVSSADLPRNQVGDEVTSKQSNQAQVSGSNNSNVQATPLPEDSQDDTITTTEAAKKPPQSLETLTKRPISKAEVTEKIKAKSVTTEKTQTAEKDKAKKPSTKLVRYSIQAGSFNKRENAQTLVDKLRKQGMPATIVAKGDLFRVKIGPSLNKAKAKEMKAKLDKQNIKGLLTSE